MSDNNQTPAVPKTVELSGQFLEGVRSALLTIVDLIEREMGVSPRTAEIRQQWRRGIHDA